MPNKKPSTPRRNTVKKVKLVPRTYRAPPRLYAPVDAIGDLVSRGDTFVFEGDEWTVIGWDYVADVILMQRPTKPGESNLAPTGLQMPLIVRHVRREKLGWNWK